MSQLFERRRDVRRGHLLILKVLPAEDLPDDGQPAKSPMALRDRAQWFYQ